MFISSVHASLIPSTHAQETLTQGVVQNSWSTRASMPSGMSGLGVAVVNGKIYAFGYNVTYEYDPVRDKWAKKRAMPTPRTCFAVAAYQNKI
ncbi:MAG: kelch repeat-containing protein, partial [Candidatus Bathyarchaeia archaeon]